MPADGAASSLIDQIVREGARRMLAAALRAEVDAYIAEFSGQRDECGHRLVVRNGSAEARTVVTSAGAVEMNALRVNDKRTQLATGEPLRFSSAILPPWTRKNPQVSEVLPLLYLHGLSSGDFVPALGQFLGTSAGLSSSTITRLTEDWKAEASAFMRRDLSGADYVYVWADGIHVNIRLEEAKLCLLVMIGVRADGRKELIALADGYRESSESWADLLRDCARRGMRAPVLAAGDGALGFWKALREVFPATKEQRCWFHKIANVLAALPKSAHPGAKKALAEIWNADDKDHARTADQGSSPHHSAPSSPRPPPRSPTMRTSCSRSTTTPPSTGCICVPRTRSNLRSPPCGTGPRSPRDPARRRPGWPWPTSSSSPRSAAGAPSTHPTSSPSSAPARSSSTASSSNGPKTRHPLLTVSHHPRPERRSPKPPKRS